VVETEDDYAFLDLTKADELIISMPIFDMEARLRSLKLFAEAQRSLEDRALG